MDGSHPPAMPHAPARPHVGHNGNGVARTRTDSLPRPADNGSPTSRVRVDGKFFAVGDERFAFRGVTYGTFAPREDGAQFPERRRIAERHGRRSARPGSRSSAPTRSRPTT